MASKVKEKEGDNNNSPSLIEGERGLERVPHSEHEAILQCPIPPQYSDDSPKNTERSDRPCNREYGFLSNFNISEEECNLRDVLEASRHMALDFSTPFFAVKHVLSSNVHTIDMQKKALRVLIFVMNETELNDIYSNQQRIKTIIRIMERSDRA